MSGPVAHADDDEDDDDDDADTLCVYTPKQKEVPLSQPPCSDETRFPAAKQELKLLCCETLLPSVNTYVGSFQQQCSECTVKYLWSDGCLYEGEWGSENRSGRAKLYWPSGSSYEGDIMGGKLHGAGTYKGVDGTVYKGKWISNKKHGFGRKIYANGDVYEGSWKWDVPEGRGRYFWSNGSVYSGDWRGGMMCGRGVLSWASGDKYNGQWLNSLPDGHGVYTWADGSIYSGTWKRGVKYGGGRIYPPRSRCIEIDRLPNVDSEYREQDIASNECEIRRRHRVYSSSDDVPEVFRSGHGCLADELPITLLSSNMENGQEHSLFLERPWRLHGAAPSLSRLHEVNTFSTFKSGTLESSNNFFGKEQDLVVVPVKKEYKEYIEGNLISQLAEETLASSSAKQLRKRQRWLMQEHRRPGETIYKGHKSYDLMLNLQLGIRYSVGKITPERNRKLFPPDFGPKARIRVTFPREGSQLTPPHQSADFKWKDYCPMVFRHLREVFKIDAAEYMLSICGNDGLRELSSPGKSGSVFYLSHDERFIIKTLRKAEVKVLLGMLPKYYKHVRRYENTLITKFFGLHRVKLAGGQKVRFIVMGNVVSTDSWIHRRFDLKGSSQGRSTEKYETDENTTLKDLDLDFVFHLEPSLRDAVLEQIFRDCQFLESEHIMDYSLLLGLHFKVPRLPSAFSLGHVSMIDLPLHEAMVSKFLANNAALKEQEVNCKCLVSVSPERQHNSKALARESTFASAGGAAADTRLSATERYSIRLGLNMPAKACRRLQKGNGDSHFREVYDVVLYFGIIDILQRYDMGKKLEHAYKSIQFDSLSISAVDPALYSKRFQQFMHQIFPVNP